jgi:hypothetical protein
MVMFTISGVYGEKYDATGNIVRQRQVFKTTLNGKKGVESFIQQMTPIEQIKVVDLNTNQDVTEEFLDVEIKNG